MRISRGLQSGSMVVVKGLRDAEFAIEQLRGCEAIFAGLTESWSSDICLLAEVVAALVDWGHDHVIPDQQEQ